MRDRRYGFFTRLKNWVGISLILISVTALAVTPPQDDKTQTKKPVPKAQPKSVAEDETITDSLVKARWRIQKIAPVEVADLDSSALDLRWPDNIRQEVEYDDSLNV